MKLDEDYDKWFLNYLTQNENGPSAAEAFLWTKRWYENALSSTLYVETEAIESESVKKSKLKRIVHEFCDERDRQSCQGASSN